MTSIIKTSISYSLKTKFKILCIQDGMTISSMMECLIKDFIETDQDIDIPEELSLTLQDTVVVKGYVPDSLKSQFKALCNRRKIPMNLVLYYMIKTWVKEHP